MIWAKLAIANSWLREGGQRGLTQANAEYNDFALFYPKADDLRERITVTPNPARATHARSLIREVTPTYPANLLAQGIEGNVQLVAVVSKEGIPDSIKVLSTPEHEDFATAAIDAVRRWRYTPMLVNGQLIRVLTTIQVNFRLNGQ
jgi:TonB family protein